MKITPTINVPETIRRLRIKAGSEDVGIRGVFGQPGMAKDFGGNYDIEGIATTNDIDSSREVVVPEGADLTYFIQNKSIFVDHMYDTASCVGKIRVNALQMIRDNSGQPTGWRVRIAMGKNYNQKLVKDCMGLAQDGIGMSIGFRAIDWGSPTSDEAKRWPGVQTVIRKWQWLELSLTPFPCNVACRGWAMDDPEPMQEQYEAVAKSIVRHNCHRKTIWLPTQLDQKAVETKAAETTLDTPPRKVVILPA